jgi:hypothetical protein
MIPVCLPANAAKTNTFALELLSFSMTFANVDGTLTGKLISESLLALAIVMLAALLGLVLSPGGSREDVSSRQQCVLQIPLGHHFIWPLAMLG